MQTTDITRPNGSSDRYDVRAVEQHWQQRWALEGIYHAEISDKPKYYCLEQFPYPSGHLHMGHVRVFTLGDVVARYRRMRGYSVMHPMGWDAFGMPAENAAIKSGIPPRVSTLANIEYMKKQMQDMGLSFDWRREVTTSEPDYYRFTQELFLLFHSRGLAYRRDGAVNWCPSCETVLANEQVEEGQCWRCDSVVTKRDLTQWYFRITDYADRLLDDLKDLNWPNEIKAQQTHWIGRSEGAEIVFPVPDHNAAIRVFTTRPDTLYGATYVVLAPEHPLVESLIVGQTSQDQVRQFVAEERTRSDIERTSESSEKRGMFTGAYASHPLTGAPVPIWVANYVLVDYGTGAVMGVPAHDQRDFMYATKYGLPIRPVIRPEGVSAPGDQAYTGPGLLIHSEAFDGMPNGEAKRAIADALESKGLGARKVTYRMRDWLISRQRYWGAPIPIVYCDTCGVVPVPRGELPVLLPENVQFTGSGGSPLSGALDWVHTECPQCGGPARRETDTMDTFVDSSWYYLRYTSPGAHGPFDVGKANYWMPVDEYVGGKEHAVLHMLYSRFFTKVLCDAGWIDYQEPFNHLLVQGMVVYGGSKMSKSKGNTISPETIMAEWGSDATRLFMLFAAPPDKDFEWSDQGVEGTYRFLQRVYRLVTRSPLGRSDSERGALQRILRARAHAIRKVTEDLSVRSAFNTAVSTLMEFTNTLYAEGEAVADAALVQAEEALILLLAPFAPHLADELWHQLGHEASVHLEAWPSYDPVWLEEEEIEIAIQVNGKVRGRMVVAKAATPEELITLALAHDQVVSQVAGHEVVKVVPIPGRLVNVVVR